MSKSNGEKARAHLAKRRRTAQRAKDRALRTATLLKQPEKPAAEEQPAKE